MKFSRQFFRLTTLLAKLSSVGILSYRHYGKRIQFENTSLCVKLMQTKRMYMLCKTIIDLQ